MYSHRQIDRVVDCLIPRVFLAGCLIYWLLPIPLFSQSYSAYFNNPHDQEHRFDIQSAFIGEISNATSTVDLTIYNINSGDIRDALIDWNNNTTHNARIVTDIQVDETNYATCVVELSNDGIEIEHDTPASYSMHDKFAIFDSSKVWTGSWNHTVESSIYQWNNAILIDDYWLGLAFETEFNQMLGETGVLYDGSFHQYKSQVAGSFALGGGTADDRYRMSPQNDENDTTEDMIVAEIEATEAGDSIYFAVYVFTDSAISLALQEAAGHGVTVRGIFDKAQANGGASSGVYQDLQEEGCDVFWLPADPGQAASPYVHHKYMVLNPLGADPVVITGSANFTAVALAVRTGGNDENTLMLRDEDVALDYFRLMTFLCERFSRLRQEYQHQA